jgi:hypothetical protein
LLFVDDGRAKHAMDPELFVYRSGREEMLPLFMAKEILNMTGLDVRQARPDEKALFVITIPSDKFQY